MSDFPRISILLALYATDMDYMVAQLDSLNSQTYPNLELLICYDGPRSNATKAIEAEVRQRITAFPYRMSYNNVNMGCNKTFERLIHAADSAYIAFCDQDDIWVNEKLTVEMEVMQKTDAQLVCSAIRNVDEDGNPLDSALQTTVNHAALPVYYHFSVTPSFLNRTVVTGCTILMRTEAARACVPFLLMYDAVLALYCSDRKAAVRIDRALVLHRIHAGNQTGPLRGITDRASYIQKKIQGDLDKAYIFTTGIPKFSSDFSLLWRRYTLWCEARLAWQRKRSVKSLLTIVKEGAFSWQLTIFDIALPFLPEWIVCSIIHGVHGRLRESAVVLGGQTTAGNAIQQALRDEHCPFFAPNDQQSLSLDRICTLIHRKRPTMVFDCRGMEPSIEPMRAAADAERLAGACKAIGAKLFYLSSACVFGHMDSSSHAPGDVPVPDCDAGRALLAAEAAIQRTTKRHVIARVSFLYGSGSTPSMQCKPDQLAEGTALPLDNEERFSPTYAPDFARCALKLVTESQFGLHHIAPSDDCTQAEFIGEYQLGRNAMAQKSACIYPSEFSTQRHAAYLQADQAAKLDNWRCGLWQHAFDTFMQQYNHKRKRPLHQLADMARAGMPKISLLTPLYNTPAWVLAAMLDSVQHQTYPNWELCLADGSDNGHREVGSIARKYAARDSRIRYKKLKQNGGISANTNCCLHMATGEYLAALDHDDVLHPHALQEIFFAIGREKADFIYTDEASFEQTPEKAHLIHRKPDYAPDTLRSNNYICHLTAFSRILQQKVGEYDSRYDGSQDHDMILRLTEVAEKITHIQKVLYYWRCLPSSTAADSAAKPYAVQAGLLAIDAHLSRIGLEGKVESLQYPGFYRVRYALTHHPLVSIIIPTSDHPQMLRTCVDSILQKTSYAPYEIVLVENASRQPETFALYHELLQDKRVRITSTTQSSFNYSALVNDGVGQARGEQLLLLNNDTEVISENWIEEMLMFAQRDDVGVVGAKLYYRDNTIQHAGVGIGLLGVAGHYHRLFPRSHPGYMGRLIYAQDLSAVTGACTMIPRRVFERLKGYDTRFQVAFNDIDFCMRARALGLLVVFTPYAELYHDESQSRGLDSTVEKRERFIRECELFKTRWQTIVHRGDPYYNPGFSPDSERFD